MSEEIAKNEKKDFMLEMSNTANERVSSILFNAEKMKALDCIADIMATGLCTIPKHLQGKKSDCFAIALQSMMWGMNPYAVAQKTHIVNGVLGYESQLVNSVVSSLGAIRGAFKYEYRNEKSNFDFECRVGAVLVNETEITWGNWLNIKDVTIKNSPLWKTNPKQQIAYLQVKNWARLYAPATMLGVYSVDELEVDPINVTPFKEPAVETNNQTSDNAVNSEEQSTCNTQNGANYEGEVISDNYITVPQIKRLFAIANENNVCTDDVKKIIKEVAGVEHTKEITQDEYDFVIDAIEKFNAEPGNE